MAVGRITGPLLAKNLLRDGIDLSFETDLLYLDVTNNRIGIRTATPQYALDVNGDTNVQSLRVVTTSTLGGLTVTTSETGTTFINNTTGPVVIEAPTEKKVYIKNNTVVDGNLHATGNITANGSVQIGNITGSDTLSLYADIVSNITPQTPNQYNIGAENLPWANVYAQNVVADAFRSTRGKDIDLFPELGGTVNIRGNIRVWGENPIGTAPFITNTLYVSMDGSDTNDGRSPDPAHACRTISGAVKSPYYKEGTSIKVAPGRYFENNPIELKPLTSVIGSDLRTTFVEPINKTQDLFWVKSGCYIAQMQMSNGQSGLLPGGGYINGTNRGAYAVAFKPNFGGEKIDVFYSPYIQNCTNQSGPWLQDGTMFIPNQTVQIPEAVGTGTWVANTTTMVVYVNEGTLRVGQSINVGPTPQGFVNARTLLLANKSFLQEQVIAYIDEKYNYYGYDETKCRRDTGLIVDSLVADLVFPDNGYTQSNFAGLQYWNQNGYTGQIPNEITPTTAAITYVSELAQKVVVNDTTGTRYQSTITQSTGTSASSVEVAKVYTDFTTILNILSSGTAGVTDIIEPNGISVVSTGAQFAANLLLNNKSYIQAEAVAFVDANYGTGFTYNQTKCARDVGLIVDSLALDLVFNGDTQATFSGLSYWNQSGYTGAIGSEITTTTNAINYVKDLAKKIVLNVTTGTRYQSTVSQVTTITTATAFEQTVIDNNVSLIVNIINSGTTGYSDLVVTNGIYASSTSSVVNAYTNLLANKAYIQSEAVAFVEATKAPGFTYDQAKCYRDMGYIVDSVAFDLLYGGNLQSVHSGVYYYGFSGSTALPGEQTEAVSAYNYLKSIVDEIILGNTITTPYQSTVTQVLSGSVGTTIEVNSVRSKIDIINDIIVNGPTGYTPQPISQTRSSNTSVINAAALLKANKPFLQAELVAYINQTFGAFNYDRAKCARDVGYMIDSVAFDVLYGGNRQAIHSGVYYYGFSGTSSAIERERPQTTAAYYRIKDIVQKLITNQLVERSPGNDNVQVVSLPAASSSEAVPLKAMVDQITTIINAGPEVADVPTPISLTRTTDTEAIKAANILIANKSFIVDEVIGYIEYAYNNGFAYNQPKCYRDTGLIVDSVAFDVLYGGLTQSTFSGLQYWNQSNYTGQISAELTSTVAAINYASILAQQVIINSTGTRYQSTVTQTLNFVYNQPKCERDTGLIIDAIGLDLLFNSNSQSTFAGVQYWNHGSYVGAIASELTTTTNAVNYIRDLAKKIIINDTSGARYQSTVTQTIAYSAATSAEQTILNTEFGLVTSILTSGTSGVTDLIVPNGIVASTNVNVQNAYDSLLANKAYLQTEAVAFVEATKALGYSYDQAKCYRDIGYIVDSVAFDLLYGGNLQAITSGVYYWGYNGTSTALPGEQTQAVAAYNYLKAMLPDVVTGQPLASPYQTAVKQVTTSSVGTLVEATSMQADIDIITNIITNGPGVAGAPSPISLTISTDTNVVNAVTLLKANRNFLVAEVIAYINDTFGSVASISEVETIAQEFGIISSIIQNGTIGVTDLIVPNGSASTQTNIINAFNSLLANKSYIQAETVAYVNSLNKIFDTAKCYRDTALVLDAITQDLLFTTSSQSTFAGLQYWNQTNTEAIIPGEFTTTTNAINYIKSLAQKVVVGDTTGARYSTGTQVTGLTTATSAEQVIIGNDFDVVLNILSSGTAGVTDLIVPNGLSISPDNNVQNAYALLEANRVYLQQEAVAYVEATKTVGYTYDQALCFRDMGYIVDSVAFDLLYTGNRQAVQAGVYYYGFSGTASAIPGESANTIEAFNKLKEVVGYVVRGEVLPVNYQNTITQVVSVSTASSADVSALGASVDLINNIILNGPGFVTAKTPISLTESASTSTLNAVTLISANRDFIVSEVLGYISNPSNFQYDPGKCYRDVGYMLESVAFDLLHGGNRQAVHSGVYYYDFNGNSSAIASEIPQTTAAYNHIRNIIGKILTNQPVAKTTGNTATQVLLASTATSAEVTLAYEKIDEITNIINNGPTVAGPKQPISQTASTTASIVTAYNLLLANKTFIQEETVAFVNQFDTGFVYNRAKCRRDVGIIVENVAYDVAFGGNEKSREAGLAYWNGVTSVIQGEILETADAIGYLNALSQAVILNTTATNILNTYQTAPQIFNYTLNDAGVAGGILTKLYNIIADIVQYGPTVAPTLQIGNGPDWGTVSAEVLLQTNRSFIQNEIISWINYNFPDFKYREDKCYRDVGFIIDAVTQDLVVNGNAKSIEAAKTYWTGNINVLENASYGDKNQVPETVAAINRVRDIALQVVANSTVTTTSFVFNPTKCSRDTGLIVDALAQDLLFQGDSQTTFAGIQYWNHGTYVGDVLNQLTTTTEAINYISDLAQKCIVNDISGTRYQNTVTQVTNLPAATVAEVSTVAGHFSTVTDILINGVEGVTNKIVPNGLTKSGNVNVQRAYQILEANIDYLQAEAIAWVEANKNFRYDKAKCSRDSGLIVDAIMLDLAYPTQSNSQATFAGLSYWNQNAYTGLISDELTTTTAAINYVKDLSVKVIQNITSGIRYQNTLTQTISTQSGTVSEAAQLIDNYSLITTVLSSGTAGITDLIVPNGIDPIGTTSTVASYNLLRSNREYILAEAVAFVEATKAPGFDYDQAKCYRDVGYILDSVCFDLLHGGNRQSVQSGVYYYTFDGSSTAIPNEIPQTTAAFEFIKTISRLIVQNIAVTPLQSSVAQDFSLTPANPAVVAAVEDPADRVLEIVKRGPSVVATKEPINLSQTGDVDRLRAAKILEANRDFIVAETIAYVDSNSAYQYDASTCARDVGFIVQSVAFDLLYGGNRQSIQSGVYYWGYTNNSTSLPKEQIASTLAYQYMKTIVADVVTGTLNTTTYQTTVTQVINLPAGTSVEADVLGSYIDNITKIINEGPQAASPARPIDHVESNNQFVRNAVNLLHANREFIQAEVIAYVQETQVSNDQIFLPFYDKGEYASLGIIRNFGIITNIIQNGMGVAPQRSDGNGIFVRAGLSNNDVKIAPVITSINTLSYGVYQVELSQSTIGFGDQQTLYFGETAVFPKLDEDVPDRWQQRRINPIGSMGGALIDGGVVSDRSPINSFVFDAFTQLNQGGIGVHITNNGYAQLVSVFTIFCSKSVIVENGGICSITNSNANFGDLCLVAKGYGRREFSGYIANPPVLPYYPNGVYPQGGQVNVYIADPDLRPHISLVMEVEPPVGYINNQGLPGFLGGQTTIDVLSTGTIDITGVDTTGFVIGQEFFIRDQYGKQVDSNNQPYVRPGTIVADVNYQTITLNYPLNSGGGEIGNFNYFNLYSCGKAYYTVLSSTVGTDPIAPGTLLLPNNQNLQEGDSLMYLNTLSQYIIQNLPVTAISSGTQKFDYTLTGGGGAGQFITDRLNLIKSILVNGPSSVPRVERTGALPSGAATAASLLNQNRTFLQDEIIKYVDTTFFTFSYNQAKCGRDTGLIVDAIITDLLFNTTSQSTFAGIQYWNQDGYTGQIPNELTTTTAAIGYVKTLTQEVVRGIIGSRYTTATQVTNLTLATAAEATTVGSKFDVILGILTSGTSGVTDIIVPNGIDVSSNVNVRNAYALIQANKSYIQKEAVAFVEATKPGFHYDQTKCARDAGLILEGIALDLVFPTSSNSQATFSGLSYWNQTGYTGSIASEITTTTNAINYVKGLVEQVVQNVTTGTRYSTGTQVTVPGSVGTGTDVAKLNGEFDLILSILNNGTAGVTDLVDSGGFTYDKTKCSRDTGLIVDAIAQDMLFEGVSQSTFAGIQYWVQSGYVGAIAGELTTTTNAINWIKGIAQKVIKNDTSGVRYTTGQVTGIAATTSEVASIGKKFDLIIDILTNGVAGVTDRIEPNGLTSSSDLDVIHAYNLLQANRSYLAAEAVAYVEATKSLGYTYDQSLCARDVGYMIDSVSFDLLYGGNRQSIQSGVYYWNYTSTTSSIAGEIAQATAAYNYIKTLSDSIIRGITVTPRQTAIAQNTSLTPGNATAVTQAQAKVDVITNIINNGPGVVTTKEPIDLTQSSDINIINGAKILSANREFIVAETIAYIDTMFPAVGITSSTNTSTVNAYNLLIANNAFIQQEAVAYVEATKTVGFTYDQTKCARDVGYMVNSVAFDLLYGGNRQALQSAVYYYNFSGTTAIPNEVSTTTSAFNFLNSIAQSVISGVQVTPRQTRYTQVFSTNTGTNSDTSSINQQITYLNNIITSGPGVVTTKEPISLTRTASTTTFNAASLLIANKDFLVAETLAYINQTYSFDYDQALCERDVGYMIDSVSFDLLYGGNRQSVQSGVYYYSFDSTSSAIAGEITQSIAAYQHIKDLAEKIILGEVVTTQQSTVTQVVSMSTGTVYEVGTVQERLDNITNIIENGPGVVKAKTPVSLSRSTSTSVINAAKILQANRQFIVAETIAYVNNAFSVYNKDKCRRDVGLIVDALIYDLEKGGNYNAIIAGKSYYAQTGTFHVTQLEENVTDPALFPDGAIVTFYQRSYMSASGYLFEYVGAGANYGALPQRGIADPVQGKETVQLNNGKVFFTSTDQNGDFRIGPGLVISQATGVLSGRTFTKSLFANLTPFILAIEG